MDQSIYRRRDNNSLPLYYFKYRTYLFSVNDFLMTPYKLIIEASEPEIPLEVPNPGLAYAVCLVGMRYESQRLNESARILDKDMDEIARVHGMEQPRTFLFEQGVPIHFPFYVVDDYEAGGNKIVVWGYLLDNPRKTV